MQDLENIKSLLYFEKASSCFSTMFYYLSKVSYNIVYEKNNNFSHKLPLLEAEKNYINFTNDEIPLCEVLFDNSYNNFNTSFSDYIKINFEYDQKVFFYDLKNRNRGPDDDTYQLFYLTKDAWTFTEDYTKNNLPSIDGSVLAFQGDLASMEMIQASMKKIYINNYKEVDSFKNKLSYLEQASSASSYTYESLEAMKIEFSNFFQFYKSDFVNYVQNSGFETTVNDFFTNLEKQSYPFTSYYENCVKLVDSGNSLLDNYINNIGD